MLIANAEDHSNSSKDSIRRLTFSIQKYEKISYWVIYTRACVLRLKVLKANNWHVVI